MTKRRIRTRSTKRKRRALNQRDYQWYSKPRHRSLFDSSDTGDVQKGDQELQGYGVDKSPKQPDRNSHDPYHNDDGNDIQALDLSLDD